MGIPAKAKKSTCLITTVLIQSWMVLCSISASSLSIFLLSSSSLCLRSDSQVVMSAAALPPPPPPFSSTTDPRVQQASPCFQRNLKIKCSGGLSTVKMLSAHKSPTIPKFFTIHSMVTPNVAPLRVVPKAPASPADAHNPAVFVGMWEEPQLHVATNTDATAAARITPATTEVIAVVRAVAPIRVPSPRAPTVWTSSITGSVVVAWSSLPGSGPLGPLWLPVCSLPQLPVQSPQRPL
ncbi:hypothetical protein INR49_002608 [Caranx melampygus]|nr:hypothetical protein INR49_002608 [Caranx melampygus]